MSPSPGHIDKRPCLNFSCLSKSPPLPAPFSREFFSGWAHSNILRIPLDGCTFTRRLREPVRAERANRVSRSTCTRHVVARNPFSCAVKRQKDAQRTELRILKRNKYFNIMATDVVDDREMREAQRDYLDFLDDDVSLALAQLNT